MTTKNALNIASSRTVDSWIAANGHTYEIECVVYKDYVIWRGFRTAKKKKIIRGFKFKNIEDFNAHVERFKTELAYSIEQREERKVKRRAEAKERKEGMKNDLKVWDVLHGSRGYNMTHNEFYQVIAKKGFKVKIQRISTECTDWDEGFTWEEKPIKNSLVAGTEVDKMIWALLIKKSWQSK